MGMRTGVSQPLHTPAAQPGRSGAAPAAELRQTPRQPEPPMHQALPPLQLAQAGRLISIAIERGKATKKPTEVRKKEGLTVRCDPQAGRATFN